jgi:hypothetical protein
MFGVTQVSKSLFKSIINWMDLNMALLTAKTLCFYECAKTPPVHNNNNMVFLDSRVETLGKKRPAPYKVI